MKAAHEGPLTFAKVEPNVGLKAALAMGRDNIIGEISASSLKGWGR